MEPVPVKKTIGSNGKPYKHLQPSKYEYICPKCGQKRIERQIH